MGLQERREGKSPVLLLTDNIERINQRVKLIPYALQGVTDRLRAVQELNAVGVGLIFHGEGPLDVCCVSPARKGHRGLDTRDCSQASLLPITTHPAHNRLMSPLGRVSRLAQKLWFPPFQLHRPITVAEIAPVHRGRPTAGFQGLNTWACIKLEGTLNWSPPWPSPASSTSISFFLFQKCQEDLEANCREKPVALHYYIPKSFLTFTY